MTEPNERNPMTESAMQEWIEEAERLALNFAHVYAFVGDDTMPKAKDRLFAHLRTVPAVKVMTDEQIRAVMLGVEWLPIHTEAEAIEFARALLAAAPVEPPDETKLDAGIAEIMAMPEPELDESIRAEGGDPDDYARRGKKAIEQALKTIAERNRAAPVEPPGFVLVPLRMTEEMRAITEVEAWEWEDLLAAAEAITEDQYDEILCAPRPAVSPDEALLRQALEALERCYPPLGSQEADRIYTVRDVLRARLGDAE